MAIRLAIGARRSRLQRQLLTEGLVLASLGGLAAILITPWTARALIVAYSTQLAIEPASDPRVLVFVVLTSVLAGIAVAVVPIVASRHVRLTQGSESSGASHGGAPRRLTAHDTIVALQIAMARRC